MKDLIGNVLMNQVSTLLESSIYTNPINLGGSLLETNTKNEYLQTTSKVLQSSNLALASATAVGTALYELSDVLNLSWEASEKLVDVSMPLSALTILSIPVLSHVAKKMTPENKEMIERFEKMYSVAIKVLNIAVAAISLMALPEAVLFLGLPQVPVLMLSAASLGSSAYTLYQDLNQKQVS